jgi:UDP-3-O-[3-hydroxymyristoyl] glucosamine N-acyltransferase
VTLVAQDIAKAVGGQIEGDGAVQISGASGLDEATADHVSFFHNVKYIKSLEATRAQLILIPEKTDGVALPSGKTFIRTKNPQYAFAVVLGLLDRGRVRHPKGISDRAAIDPEAKVA